MSAGFLELKQRRNGTNTAASSIAQAVTTPVFAPAYAELDRDPFDIRVTSGAGRSLFAKKPFRAGSVLLEVETHISILDKAHLPILCSRCMLDKPADNLKRCSLCKCVYYCSEACQRADWKKDGHKLECNRLKAWAEASRSAGRSSDDHVPDSPIRALGRLLLLRSMRGGEWWQQVEAMATTPNELSGDEKQRQGELALATAQFVSGSEPLNALFPGSDAASITRILLKLVDQFGLNSFSLTSPDLSNIGVAVCPTVALINHSCVPNCTVVFPEGPSAKMHVVAFRDIAAGEEILSSYVDLTSPTLQRQEDLHSQYKFLCKCRLCVPTEANVDVRQAIKCVEKFCKGLIQLPDPLPDGPTTTCTCPKCGTDRTLKLSASGSPLGGLREVLEEARSQLLIKDPKAFQDLPRTRQVVFNEVLQELARILHPACFPLLALHRLAVDRALSTEVQLYGDKRYAFAQGFSRQVMEGLQAILPVGHPVRAVQRIVSARLAAIMPDGSELRDDKLLLLAYQELRDAYGEAQIAFGRKGILVGQLRDELAAFEQDLTMRQRLYTQVAA